MTVAELIQILQAHDPSATVVVNTYQDRSDVTNAVGLNVGDVRAVFLKEIHVKAAWFDPDHGAKLFEIDDDADILGVEIG